MEVFIAGYMHSGTTMLANVLGNHPDFYVIKGESRFFEHLTYNLNSYKKNNQDLKTARFLFKNFGFDILKDPQIKNAFDRNIQIYYKNGPLVFFKSVIGEVREIEKKPHLVEKSPNNLFHIDIINQHFPQSSILTIYRDVRDIIASKKKRFQTTNLDRYEEGIIKAKKLEKDFNVFSDCMAWKAAIRYQISNQIKFPEQNIIDIKYENLVLDPRSQFKSICSFIRIPFDEQMLNTDFSNASDNSAVREGIYSDSIGNYKNVLSKNEIFLSEYLCRKELLKLGYTLENSSFNYLKLTYLMAIQMSGLGRRLIKRLLFFGPNYFFVYMKNLIKRI